MTISKIIAGSLGFVLWMLITGCGPKPIPILNATPPNPSEAPRPRLDATHNAVEPMPPTRGGIDAGRKNATRRER